MKSNLYINIGEELWKTPKFHKNKSTKFNSIINNISLTTNTSGTSFTTHQNSIEQNKKPIKTLNGKIKLKKSNTKFSSLNNIFTNYNIKSEIDKYKNNIILPNLKTTKNNAKLIKKADSIIKLRHGKFKVNSLCKTKSFVLKKANEICLNNFLITQLINKRIEINSLKEEINSNLNKAEYNYYLDMNNFVNFEVNLNKKVKSLEEKYNSLRNLSLNKENTLSEIELITRRLERNIEDVTKQIILLQKNAKFIHEIFNVPFFFEKMDEIKFKEKKYLNVYDKILDLFEKNKQIFEENYKILDENEEFMKRFKFFERKIISSIQLKDKIKEEINDIKIRNKNLLEQLYVRKDDLKEEYQSLKGIIKKTNKEINYIDNIKQNNLINLETCEQCLFELGKYIGLEMNKNIKEISLSEFNSLGKEIIFHLKEKEEVTNEYIDNINDLILSEDKGIIEEIINDRKNFNKREKYREYIYNQKKEAEKRKFKVNKMDRKIIIKGRKVFRDIPIIKKKKIELNKNIDNENESFEYFRYSFDKDDI